MIFVYGLINIALLRPMQFSMKLHEIKSGWVIVYIKGSLVLISKNIGIVAYFSDNRFCQHKTVQPHGIKLV